MKRNSIFLLLGLIGLYSCDMPTPKNATEPSITQQTNKVVEDFYNADKIHIDMPIEDSSAFLGFTLGMSEKGFEVHKSQLRFK